MLTHGKTNVLINRGPDRRSRWKDRYLSGWGRTTGASVPAIEPTTIDQLKTALKDRRSTSFLAYGGGRSYDDNAINSHGRAVVMHSLDKVLSFDENTCELVCEGGVTYRDLLTQFLPKGFLVPVSPGTSYATIGGAIANDVHGKNHEFDGTLGAHINWIDLVCADGKIVRTSPENHPELFDATIGGIGLTGIIARASLTMHRTNGNALIVKETRVKDLDDFIDKLWEIRHESKYSVGWIDALKRGPALGRGILETAEFSGESISGSVRRGSRIPIEMPACTLNRWTMKAFNSIYYHRIPVEGRERSVAYDRFTYPLDSVRDWNRVYGPAGFYQFQCVLPNDESLRGIRAILKTISKAGSASCLAVLKTLGPSGHGYLSFPKRGFTLALDIRRKTGATEILKTLERLTLDHGGRIYLAKDAALSGAGFREMYPKADRYQKVLREIDPNNKFSSDMARRLGLQPAETQ